ncbi:uncharacterized protein N7459_001013 [Penicillium hispanicum]|uniref:uncharacterized protein n=1 Tax=Penicillium hispanicum TaxID=1080232 RepID=UPI002540F6AC|nr:uncharacterized protein N7459_001013 [Penicillium hispanicum]KAJ5594805.1 hypothetical protein N7459_001013 [Penicillium hispanicum]
MVLPPMSDISTIRGQRAPRGTRRISLSDGRVLTYSRCWTCRTRKVKCDERDQNGCRTCERAGVECAGYGVNLYWVTGNDQDQQIRRRRRIQLGWYTIVERKTSGLPDEEINAMLSTLDTVSMPLDTVRVGPFSIFQSRRNVTRIFTHNGELFDDWTLDPFLSARRADLPTRSSREADPLWHQDDLVALVRCNMSSGTTNKATSMPRNQSMSSIRSVSPDLALSVSLFQDRETSMLMHHYTTHVAELLQPVLHPKNPWRTTYFQFALEGCPGSPLTQASLSSSNVSTAIFHSVLSSAAFHLRNATGGSKMFHRLGLQHRAKALKALNLALVHPCDSHTYTRYLTAMLSLVTIDTMTGEDSDFPIHLDGCHNLHRPSSDRIIDDQNRRVSSIRHFLTLLARTTSYRPRSVNRQHQSLFGESYFQADDRSLEHMYGVTPALGNMLQRACDISQYLAHHDHESSLQFFEASEALKIDLLAWKLDPDQFSLLGSEKTMVEIARCQARAFHSAVLIFFYRTIEMNSSLDMEHEVCSILQNLTHAEDLKDQYMKGEKRTAPMSWPAFIGACDATDRQPWVAWWTQIQDYNIGNFKRQWEVVQELWKIMDEDVTITGWREALQRSCKLVLPI